MEAINKTIEVVTTTDSAGLIKPIYFYLDKGEDFELHVIERLIRRDKEKINGEPVIHFTCEIILYEMSSLCDLRYNEATCQWTLLRI